MVRRGTTTKLVGLSPYCWRCWLLAALAAEALGQQVVPSPPLTPPGAAVRFQAVPVLPNLAQAKGIDAQARALEHSRHPASVD